MIPILKHFDILVDQGLKIIPLHNNTKKPILKGWADLWIREYNREYIEHNPNCNIGVVLGDIIDIEGDSKEANEIILSIIKDYKHPTYKSSKSIHHLFLNPFKDLTHFCYNKIEFRGYRHQSVMPPSVVHGTPYQWLKNFHFPVPDMPEELVKFYEIAQNKKRYKIVVKPGHIKTSCHICTKEVYLHKKRFNLELIAFKELKMKWQCQTCRKIDLRPVCRYLKSNKKQPTAIQYLLKVEKEKYANETLS